MRSITKTSVIWIKSNDRVFKILGLAFFVLTGGVGVLWVFGRDVESVAFVLGCISSSMFGIVETARYIEPDRRAVRDMSLDEILNFIEVSDPDSHWRRFNTNYASEAVLVEDPRLRMTIHLNESGTQCEDFKEPWANCFSDPSAHGYWVDISYDRALIDRDILVSVDGGRAMLPIPRSRTELVVSKKQYVIARVFDSFSTLDDYMRQAGLAANV